MTIHADTRESMNQQRYFPCLAAWTGMRTIACLIQQRWHRMGSIQIEWREPKAYLVAMKQRQHAGKSWWKIHSTKLMGAGVFVVYWGGFMLQWYTLKKNPANTPPGLRNMLIVSFLGALGIALTYGVAAYLDKRYSTVQLQHGQIVRSSLFSRHGWKYTTIHAFYFETVTDHQHTWYVLALVRKNQAHPLRLGLPGQEVMEPIYKILIEKGVSYGKEQ